MMPPSSTHPATSYHMSLPLFFFLLALPVGKSPICTCLARFRKRSYCTVAFSHTLVRDLQESWDYYSPAFDNAFSGTSSTKTQTSKANDQPTWLACICFCSSACSWGAWAVMSRAFLYTSLLGSYRSCHILERTLLVWGLVHTPYGQLYAEVLSRRYNMAWMPQNI